MARVDGLSLQARRLLAALRQHGDWMTVEELAATLYDTRFRYYHLNLLEKMAVNGCIEIKRPDGNEGRMACAYRAKDSCHPTA